MGYYRYFSIVQTYDGGYAIGGLEIGFAGNNDQNFWVFKLDGGGNLLWSSSLGTTAQDACYRLIETSDHEIVAAGFAGGSSNQDLFIIKYDEDGTLLWQKNIDHGSGSSYFYSIQETPDGGYILAGVIESYAFLMKTDADGNKEWSTALDDSGAFSTPVGEDVVLSPDGGYLVSGWGLSDGAFFVKVDDEGTFQWSVTYAAGTGFDAIALTDGSYLLSGYETGAGQPHPNAFVVKIDTTGNQLWSKTYGDDGAETFYALYPTSDGGFIGAGTAETGAVIGSGDQRAFVAKCNSDGEIEWSKKVGTATLFEDVIQTADGGYAAMGNGLVVKLDAEGNSCVECLIEDFGSWMEAGSVATHSMFNVAPDDNTFASAYTEFTGGTEHELCVVTGIEEASSSPSLFSIAPNPTDQFAVISLQFAINYPLTLRIFDMTGAEILKSKILIPNTAINMSPWQNGIYFCELKSEDETSISKLIVQH